MVYTYWSIHPRTLVFCILNNIPQYFDAKIYFCVTISLLDFILLKKYNYMIVILFIKNFLIFRKYSFRGTFRSKHRQHDSFLRSRLVRLLFDKITCSVMRSVARRILWQQWTEVSRADIYSEYDVVWMPIRWLPSGDLGGDIRHVV